MLSIEQARGEDFIDLRSFYAAVGYTGGAQEADLVFLARLGDRIAGVVRLCDEESLLVLRGMYVAKDRHGTGVGTALLAATSTAIGDRECWCVPYSHLRDFYGHAGFVEVPPSAAPAFLRARALRYREKGESVIVAVRRAGSATGSATDVEPRPTRP